MIPFHSTTLSCHSRDFLLEKAAKIPISFFYLKLHPFAEQLAGLLNTTTYNIKLEVSKPTKPQLFVS